jgi:hypothetical protein
MLIQCYGFFCVWIHKKWVISEMPHLMSSEGPRVTFLQLMFPCVFSQSSNNSNNNDNQSGTETREITETGTGIGTGTGVGLIADPRTLEEGTAHVQPTPTTTNTTTAASGESR